MVRLPDLRLPFVACAIVAAPLSIAEAQERPRSTPQGTTNSVTTLDEVVVTAEGRSEPLSQTASTVQIISEEKIRNSTAKSVTDLLAENAVGFFSEWTPGQTDIGIRGGRTEGQGRDFRSQVTVLINGRRAGTSNISKLSLADVLRVEIIRGPASVIYGSSAIGGVINIILRSGQNTEGNFVQGAAGSQGLVQGNAYGAGKRGAYDYYIGLGGGRRDSYEAGQGAPEQPLSNTAWNRMSGMVASGYDFDQRNHLSVSARHDGTYDTGFRGSQWSSDSNEGRSNDSVDAIYSGQSIDGAYSWTAHGYFFNDFDDLDWTAPRQRTGAVGNRIDHDRRTQQAGGARFVPEFRLGEGNKLLLGLDVEQARLNSQRYILSVLGASRTTQIAPIDNNERNTTLGLYAEDVQQLFDDRATLRAGLRWAYGYQELLTTPNAPNLRTGATDYDHLTYSLGGAYLATDWLKLRTGVATGYRAPTATELNATFFNLGGSQTAGNNALRPETSLQFEGGFTVTQPGVIVDFALFQNTIFDRITSRVISAAGANMVSQNVNATGEGIVRGLEVQSEFDVARIFSVKDATIRLFGNGVYNFTMEDHGADPRFNPVNRGNKLQRMYEYQVALGGVFGIPGVFDIRPVGVLHGVMYYNTEEDLLATYKPNAQFVSKKDPYWVWNLRGNYYAWDGVTLFGAINNIFDENQSPIFISTDSLPYRSDPRGSNGYRGNSMPGREFVVGFQVFF
jgi:vitamin B12 transporter